MCTCTYLPATISYVPSTSTSYCTVRYVPKYLVSISVTHTSLPSPPL